MLLDTFTGGNFFVFVMIFSRMEIETQSECTPRSAMEVCVLNETHVDGARIEFNDSAPGCMRSYRYLSQSAVDRHSDKRQKVTDQHSEEGKDFFTKAFSGFDNDGDGFITAKELETAMRSLGQNTNDAMLQEMIFMMMSVGDADGNGVVDFLEFITTLDEGNLREEFQPYAADGNGFIDANELRKRLSLFGYSVEQAVGEMQFIDIDGDGRISFEEYVKRG